MAIANLARLVSGFELVGVEGFGFGFAGVEVGSEVRGVVGVASLQATHCQQ